MATAGRGRVTVLGGTLWEGPTEKEVLPSVLEEKGISGEGRAEAQPQAGASMSEESRVAGEDVGEMLVLRAETR